VLWWKYDKKQLGDENSATEAFIRSKIDHSKEVEEKFLFLCRKIVSMKFIWISVSCFFSP